MKDFSGMDERGVQDPDSYGFFGNNIIFCIEVQCNEIFFLQSLSFRKIEFRYIFGAAYFLFILRAANSCIEF